MQIDNQIYDWLKELKVISGRVKQLQNNQVMIENEQMKLMQNGILIGNIIKKLSDQPSITSDIERLKNLSNPATRVYNWNIITTSLKQMNFKLDGEIKSLIISGDIELIADLLKDLFHHFKNKAFI